MEIAPDIIKNDAQINHNPKKHNSPSQQKQFISQSGEDNDAPNQPQRRISTLEDLMNCLTSNETKEIEKILTLTPILKIIENPTIHTMCDSYLNADHKTKQIVSHLFVLLGDLCYKYSDTKLENLLLSPMTFTNNINPMDIVSDAIDKLKIQ